MPVVDIDEIEVIKYKIKNGDTIFDVGANIGIWTDFVLQNHTDITIYAFEPIPDIYKILEKKEKVKCNNLAMLDKIGLETIFYYKNIDVLSTLYRRGKKIEDRFRLSPEKIIINTSTLDYYCSINNINKINFLKVDVEGGELYVFNGAKDLLDNNKIDTIQFEYGECNLDSKISLEMIFDFFEGYNFKISKLAINGLIPINAFSKNLEDYKLCNYLLERGNRD